MQGKFALLALGSLLLASPVLAQSVEPAAGGGTAAPAIPEAPEFSGYGPFVAGVLPAFPRDLRPRHAEQPVDVLMPARQDDAGGRWMYRIVGAAIGGGALYLSLQLLDCSDCDRAAVPAGIGGAVAGFLIGDFAWRLRRAERP